MTIKVKYENGVLIPIEKVRLKEKEIYEIKIEKKRIKESNLKELRGIIGIASFGGDALLDSERIYDE